MAKAATRVRKKVKLGVEAVLTDAMSSVIIQQEVLPRFRRMKRVDRAAVTSP